MNESRYDLADMIFKTHRFPIRCTYLASIETDNDRLEERDVSHHYGSTGIPLDPSGGYFVVTEDDDHDQFLRSILRGDPRKLAHEEFDRLTENDTDEYELTINQIVELMVIYKEVCFIKPQDSIEVYRILERYMAHLERDLMVNLNGSDIPEEDKEKIAHLMESLLPLIEYLNGRAAENETADPILGYFMDNNFKPELTLNKRDGSATVKAKPDVTSERGHDSLPNSPMEDMI